MILDLPLLHSWIGQTEPELALRLWATFDAIPCSAIALTAVMGSNESCGRIAHLQYCGQLCVAGLMHLFFCFIFLSLEQNGLFAGVAWLLVEAGVRDVAVMQAALLHDTVEDTDTTHQQIRDTFGEKVASIVAEV